jgi:hypothetical protein
MSSIAHRMGLEDRLSSYVLMDCLICSIRAHKHSLWLEIEPLRGKRRSVLVQSAKLKIQHGILSLVVVLGAGLFDARFGLIELGLG